MPTTDDLLYIIGAKEVENLQLRQLLAEAQQALDTLRAEMSALDTDAESSEKET